MLLHIFYSDSFDDLISIFKAKILQKRDLKSIFLSPLVFINNNMAQNYLEHLLFSYTLPDTHFVGHINFQQWLYDLSYLIEPSDNKFSSLNWVLLLSIFFKEEHHKSSLLLENTELLTDTEEFLALANHYYTLFKEYEVYAPDIIKDWDAQNLSKDMFYKDPLLSQGFIYKQFWVWVNSLGIIKETINSFTYSSVKVVKKQFLHTSDIHIFLPQYILESQLEILKSLFPSHNIFIYCMVLNHLKEELKLFYTKTTFLDSIKDYANNLDISFTLEEVKNSNAESLPVVFYHKYDNILNEYNAILQETVYKVKNNIDLMLSDIITILPNQEEYKIYWNLTFESYKDKLPYHNIFLQEKIKPYNYFELLESLWQLSLQKGSIEFLEKILLHPIILSYKNYNKNEVKDLLDYLKSVGAWGEDPSYNQESTLTYHLNLLYFNNILDIELPFSYHLNKDIIEYCLDLIQHIMSMDIYKESLLLKEKDIEELIIFLEWLLPASFWKDFDDSYIRKDLLDFMDLLDFIKILSSISSINTSFLKMSMQKLYKKKWRADDLSFTKYRGSVVSTISDVDVFSSNCLFIAGFSEQLELLESLPFNKESALLYLPAYQTLRTSLKYISINKLIEMIYTSKECYLFFTAYDKQTKEELKPHILMTLLSSTLYKQFYNNRYAISTILESQYSRIKPLLSEELLVLPSQISSLDISHYLANPLKWQLKKRWGESFYFKEEMKLSYYAYLFSVNKLYNKKLNYLLYSNYYKLSTSLSIDSYISQSGQYGLLKDSPFNTDFINDKKDKVYQFLNQIHNHSSDWGNLYHKIYINHYKLKENISYYKIIPPPMLHDKELVGKIYFCYYKKEENFIQLTLPIVYFSSNLEKKLFPSFTLLIHTFILAISEEKPYLFIKLIVPKETNAAIVLQEKDFHFKTEDIKTYMSSLLMTMEEPMASPFFFSFLNDFYKENFSNQKDDKEETNKEDRWNQDYKTLLLDSIYNDREKDKKDKIHTELEEYFLSLFTKEAYDFPYTKLNSLYKYPIQILLDAPPYKEIK